MLGEQPVGVGRLQAVFDLIAYEAELIHLIAAVEPLPRCFERARSVRRSALPSIPATAV
jgi:hypothetical protein